MTQTLIDSTTHLAPAPVRDTPAVTPRRGWRFKLALTFAVLCLVAFGSYIYIPSLYEVSTNDAYVDAHVVSIVPKIAAYVTALNVDDNTSFAAGELLVTLDPRDFQVAVDRRGRP